MRIASAGDSVTCENGHTICTVARDIGSTEDEYVTGDQFKDWAWDYKPEPFTEIPKCPQCGAPFMRARGGPLSGHQLHVNGKWSA